MLYIRVIYQSGYHEREEILEVLRDLLKHLEHLLAARYDSSPELDKNAYIKSLLALGLYAGLVRILKEKEVFKVSEEGVELRKLRESFGRVYDLFNLRLNDTILGNEVDKIFKATGVTKGWVPVGEVLGYGDKKVQSPQERNFFAHAGLESNVTECKIEQRKDDREIYVRYAEEHRSIIERWVREK